MSEPPSAGPAEIGRQAVVGRPLALSRRRRQAVSVAVIALSAATCVAMLALAGKHAVSQRLDHLSWWFVPTVLVAHGIAYASYLLAHHHVVDRSQSLTVAWRHDVYMVVIGFGAWVHSGFTVDRRALEWLGFTPTDAGTSVSLLAVLEFTLLAPAAWVCALLLLGTPGVPESDTIPWIAGLPVGLVAALAIVARDSHASGTAVATGLARIRAELVAGLREAHALLLSRRHGPIAVGAMALYWSIDIASLWAALRFVSIPISISRLVLAYSTGYIATRRALPFAGVIVTEALMTISLVTVGVPLAAAALAMLAYRLCDFALTFAGAMLSSSAIERAQVHTAIPI